MADFSNSSAVDDLKVKGNEYFTKEDFVNSYDCYTEAIEKLKCIIELNKSPKDLNQLSILYSNRSASLLSLNRYEEALSDSEDSISCDSHYVKAYFRKATSLTFLGKHLEAYHTWLQAFDICDRSPWLVSKVREAKEKWLTQFKIYPVQSNSDMIERFNIIKDPRLKLSTLAHFWNLSSPDERLSIFKVFISIISGQGELSEQTERLFDIEKMKDLPMVNYLDLPSTDVQSWCDYYARLDSENKTGLLKNIWGMLSTKEQTLVVSDLKELIS